MEKHSFLGRYHAGTTLVEPSRSFCRSGGAGTLRGSVAAHGALKPNTWDEITTYNNFYEFGTGKSDPADNSGDMVTNPWEVTIDGIVDNAGTFSLADLIADMTIEDRLYRFRCVEAWAMVVP